MAKRLNLDDLTFDREPADSKILRIYGATKLCNILFSKELAKKLEPFGELFSLYFYSSHVYLLPSFLHVPCPLGLLKKSAPSRIIHVSSMAHAFTKTLDLNNLNSELSYDTGTVYYYSKLSQVLCTRHLAPLVFNSGVTVNCLHPGAVQTEIFRNAPSWFQMIAAITFPLFFKVSFRKNITVNALHPGVVHTEFSRFLPYEVFKKIMTVISPVFSKSAKEGAQTTIHLAVADEVANVTGEYFSDCKIAKTSKLAKDAGLAKKLWEVSETLVKLKPEERHY
ncbi:WW domain-containing oxidoreductase [Daphnia magna]|uniref:WW domain-containing oxidoreductase n=1 Tax=Daphnia magna TaxID=35525 RepID=A0A164PLG9_9CRUS|nr:WW domain-containing oxidoreductase [Daphnia magna]